MNEPNETERRQASDIYSDSESIRPTGEKIPVAHDETTVKDDALDYVFLKPKRRRHHTHENEPVSTSVASFELVRSTRNPSRRHAGNSDRLYGCHYGTQRSASPGRRWCFRSSVCCLA